jgi:hypothetical protein
MVNLQFSFSSEDNIKLSEMKKKIFTLTLTSTIKRVYRRIARTYFYKLLTTSIPKLPERKIRTINDLIKQKLDNNEDFKEDVEETYEINGKIYKITKKKNDLLIIDDKGKKKTIDNYKKKRFPYKKQHKIVPEKNEEPESGNEPYEESEEEPKSPTDKRKQLKKKDKDLEGESLSEGEQPKRRGKRKPKGDIYESLTEGEEEPEDEEQGKIIKKKKRPSSEMVKDTKDKRKPKKQRPQKEPGESIHESEEISEGKTESIEDRKKKEKISKRRRIKTKKRYKT